MNPGQEMAMTSRAHQTWQNKSLGESKRMATIVFIKRGKASNGEQNQRRFLVDLKKLIEAFPTPKPIWAGEGFPTLDSDHVTKDFETYRTVVVVVDPKEAHAPYSKPGHYFLDVRPLEVASKLGLVI